MADKSEPVSEPAKVLSFITRKALAAEVAAKEAAKEAARSSTPARPAGKPDGVRLPPEPPSHHDAKSIETLNSAVESVMKGECTGVCIISLGKSGLPRFWLTFPDGTNPQVEAVRYIGLTRLLEDILEQVAYEGVEEAGE